MRNGYEFRFDVVVENIGFLLEGLKYTISISILAMILGVAIGLIISLARLSPFRVIRYTALLFTEVMRTLPLLVVLYWFYNGLPIIAGIALEGFDAAVIAFSLNVGAFQAEDFRAGLLSIHPGQRQAGLALGMTNAQVMRRIILPQAIRRVIPLMGTQWVSLFKNTSIVAIVAVHDLMYQGRVLSVQLFRPVEILSAVALIYFLLVYPQAQFVYYLHKKYSPT